MPLVAEYHRPTNVHEALELLADGSRIPLAGGTTINADRAHAGAKVVDLQALGWNEFVPIAGSLSIGAMATLAEVAEHPDVPTVLRDLARAEQPSTMRTLATVGGTVASQDPDSMFLAGLLAFDADIEFAGSGDDQDLADVLTTGLDSRVLIAAATPYLFDIAASTGTGRTPADVPIVGAVATRNGNKIRLALTGVAATPVLVDPTDPTAGLNPPGDFRGSSAYRLELAAALSQRVIKAVS